MPTHDVIIIGGGFLGVSAAYEAAKAGLRTLLLEAGDLGSGTSGSCSGRAQVCEGHLDPLNIANEGKLIAICAAADADRLLGVLRAHPRGRDAAIIGSVVSDEARLVTMRTTFGGSRVVDWIAGEQLPRIC